MHITLFQYTQNKRETKKIYKCYYGPSQIPISFGTALGR